MTQRFWALHNHSRYSAKDGMSDIKDMVGRGVELNYPAMGLTDHGTPAGIVQFYLACKKAGISPAPGVEIYFTPDATAKELRSMHLTIAAVSTTGYRNLTALTTVAHQHFYRRPRVDFADLADFAADGMTEGLLLATGCRSGPVVRTMCEKGIEPAIRIVKTLAGWFPLTYVEIMNHGFTVDGYSDDEICEGLVAIADTVGLPLIVTGDSHYVREGDQARHNTMKEMLTFSDNPEDGRFHGEGYHLVDEAWLKRFIEPDILNRGLDSLAEIAEALCVKIPELDTFTLKVPDVTLGGDPDDELAERVITTLNADYPGDEPRAARAFAELDVIRDVGMAGYLLLVVMITDMMRENHIWFWARGSAAGSFVTYLLGITQVDPNPDVWDIRMDRFLSGDRTSPPDIDLDIDSARRPEVVAWVKERFAIRPVAIYSTYQLDATDDEQSGSLKVEYWSTARKRAAATGGGHVEEGRIPAGDWDMLKDLSSYRLIKNTGSNAAGFLVAETEHELDIVPLVKIGSGSTGPERLVTAYDKDDVEPLGFPKVDLLGLRMLSALRIACTLIAGAGDNPVDPIEYFWSLPLEDRDTLDRAGSGNTAGMFQLEGFSQRSGLEELDPQTTMDIVAAQALFRPGVSREFLGTYMRRRRGQEPVPVVHPDIAKELATTYGVAIFQEQVVGVLRDIGMTPLALTGMLKAVKASGKQGIAKAKEAVTEALPGIIALAQARGWEEADIKWIEAALTDYGAGYSFNKGHSAIYGVVAYFTAYLATHEPLGFWTGILVAYTGHKDAKKVDKEVVYQRAARDCGITISRPHVNKSQVDYFPEAWAKKNVIRTGLISVSGVGRTAAEEIVNKRKDKPYESYKDLGKRVSNSKVTGAKDLAIHGDPAKLGETTALFRLWKAKALEGLEPPNATP